MNISLHDCLAVDLLVSLLDDPALCSAIFAILTLTIENLKLVRLAERLSGQVCSLPEAKGVNVSLTAVTLEKLQICNPYEHTTPF